MSGSGRKSAYRKGVTKRVLYGDPEPSEHELIVRVTALRGTNLFEVRGRLHSFLLLAGIGVCRADCNGLCRSLTPMGRNQ